MRRSDHPLKETTSRFVGADDEHLIAVFLGEAGHLRERVARLSSLHQLTPPRRCIAPSATSPSAGARPEPLASGGSVALATQHLVSKRHRAERHVLR